MEQDNKKEESKGFLAKVKENTEDEIQILGTFVRLGVVVWSGFIITLNYVDLPMIKKGQSGGDITFVASRVYRRTCHFWPDNIKQQSCF